ncbi:hypothetical protein E2C01_053290 [Portunus trituberculatus]|uniref:Uncharacterized protein n=1 Tax=Portunus trituberculatus TaxID=210409 RepID=A0A5B7GRM5_PORTR|nr:hypothetical protein [Portunus trituberculatus]
MTVTEEKARRGDEIYEDLALERFITINSALISLRLATPFRPQHDGLMLTPPAPHFTSIAPFSFISTRQKDAGVRDDGRGK